MDRCVTHEYIQPGLILEGQGNASSTISRLEAELAAADSRLQSLGAPKDVQSVLSEVLLTCVGLSRASAVSRMEHLELQLQNTQNTSLQHASAASANKYTIFFSTVYSQLCLAGWSQCYGAYR